MGDELSLALGIMGNAVSLMLYSVPMLTIVKIFKERSTEGLSCAPHILAMLNCFLDIWYGFSAMESNDNNITDIIVSGVGILSYFSLVVVYFWFAPRAEKKKAAAMMIMMIGVIVLTVIVSTLILPYHHPHHHHRQRIFVGSVRLVTYVAACYFPLAIVWKVIRSNSVESMQPVGSSLLSFVSGSLWTPNEIVFRRHDLLFNFPSILQCVMGLLELVVYFKYRNSTTQTAV